MPTNEERPFSRSQPEQFDVWKIALGVALGITIAAVLAFAVRMYFVQQAVDQFNKEMQKVTVDLQRSAELGLQRQAFRQQQALELANQQKLDKAAAQRVANDEVLQQLDEVERKQDAWQRFYKKPAHCDKSEGEAFMECANGHIRAKRKFEDLYAAGKL